MPLWAEIAVLIGCYLIGGLSPGYWLVLLRTGEDVRRRDSGSTGARNVGRQLGRGWAVATFALDAAKGAAAVGLARWLGVDGWMLAATPAAVVSGHIWPVQLGFRGGRGLSPGIGAVLALAPVVAVGIVAVVGIVAAATRQLGLSVLIAVALAPVIALATRQGGEVSVGVAAAALIALYAHRARIRAMIERRPPASAPGSVGRESP